MKRAAAQQVEEPVKESVLYLAITESQARRIAACEQDTIRDVVVDCCRFMLDCEWGGLSKYIGDPPARNQKGTP